METNKSLVLYGYYVKIEDVRILKNGVKKVTIDTEFVEYWNIPKIAYVY